MKQRVDMPGNSDELTSSGYGFSNSETSNDDLLPADIFSTNTRPAYSRKVVFLLFIYLFLTVNRTAPRGSLQNVDSLPARANIANSFGDAEKTLQISTSHVLLNSWWLGVVGAILFQAVFYTLVRYRARQQFKSRLERLDKEKQIAELGKKTAELQQQKIEMEMQALRAQMNPHFIFNSLNSINRFILQNDRAQASGYLTKFSKLVRTILQNSQASLITLESELESLDLYLNLEALRFNYHFDYTINVPKDMDIEVLQVPPLILQPYVENAIWHGLMHKEEKGHLEIGISEKDDHLFFTVKDNGIGRQRAKALASKSATKHKSMGLRITENRISILQKNGSQESPVTIHDLVDTDGCAAGTEVTIKMPLIYD